MNTTLATLTVLSILSLVAEADEGGWIRGQRTGVPEGAVSALWLFVTEDADQPVAFGKVVGMGYGHDCNVQRVEGGWQIVVKDLFLRFPAAAPVDGAPVVAVAKDPDEHCIWRIETVPNDPQRPETRPDPNVGKEGFTFIASPANGEYKGWYLAAGELWGQPDRSHRRAVRVTLRKERYELKFHRDGGL